MALDDRDRNFEKALARHLRYIAPSDKDADAPVGASLELCPDPEILAAYHEQSLSSDELSLWKQHVVACSGCQFVLAQLAATENLALDPAPAQDPPLVPARASSRKEPPSDTRFVNGQRRPPSWRWVLLIPAGAIAASFVAWVSLRNSVPLPSSVPSSSSVQTAENQPPPPLASQPKPTIVAPSDREEKVQPASPAAGAIGGVISPKRDAPASAPQNDLQLNQQSPNQLTAIPHHGPSVALQQQQRQQTSQPLLGGPIVDAKKSEAEAGSRLKQEGKQLASQLPSPPPPPPSAEPSFLDQNTVAAPPVSRVTPAPSTPAPSPAGAQVLPKEKSTAADAISSTSESVEVSAEPQSRAQAKAMLRAAALQNPHVFVAPDGKHLWRIGPAGSLERSKDEGVKWTAQVSGVNADLAAGSAPSARVAWIVGSSGTILRTTDAGEHWTKLDSPVANDLTGVRAIDAFHATIWFVADPQTVALKTYETADGGATWSPIPPQ